MIQEESDTIPLDEHTGLSPAQKRKDDYLMFLKGYIENTGDLINARRADLNARSMRGQEGQFLNDNPDNYIL